MREVDQLAHDFVDSNASILEGESGELFDFFNPLLNESRLPASSNLDAAQRALCVANIFSYLGKRRSYVRSAKAIQLCGWNGLNKDAKNWCKRLLAETLDKDVSPDIALLVLTAKGFVGSLVGEFAPDPPPRHPWI